MPKVKKNGKEYEVAEWQVENLKGKPGWQEVKEKPVKPAKDNAPEIPDGGESPA